MIIFIRFGKEEFSQVVDKVGYESIFSTSNEYGKIYVPNGIQTIKTKTFESCKINVVDLQSSATSPTLTTIEKTAFARATLTTINIPKSIKEIPAECFYSCSLLTNVTLVEGLERIGSNGFEDCSSLVSIKIPTSVTVIAYACFYNCTSLKTINIPSGVTKLSGSCFEDCTSLNGVTIPSKVTSIEYRCFENCSSWSGTLSLPANLTSIGYSAFAGCVSLTGTLVLPSKITSIGYSAFQNCSGFTGLTFKCQISSIAYSTFENCSSIANTVTIPSSVTSIGDSAFSGCKQIKRFNFQTDTAPSVGSNAFSNGFADVQIWIPKYDNYVSYRDALNNKGFVDRKTGSGAIMHSNDYCTLNNSNRQYDHDLARYYDGRWRKVLFAYTQRVVSNFSTGHAKLLSVNNSYLAFLNEEFFEGMMGDTYSGSTVISYEILEGYSYKIETKTGNAWGKPMASWLNRNVTLCQIYAKSSTSLYVSSRGGEIKTGDNFYGNYDATSYCDISPEDYNLQSIYVYAKST